MMKESFKIYSGLAVVLSLLISTFISETTHRTYSKNGMTVELEHRSEHLHVTMKAPTVGWVAVGFNEGPELRHTYLIMGAIRNERIVVEEHAVYQPGEYRTFRESGEPISIININGIETPDSTVISFDVPIKPSSQYGKNLSCGNTYTLLMAFSREDDFQHHSIMRTSLQIKL